ncbi:MAG: hypothetical protein AAFU38_18575 [Bacteroidota bacterium]
MLTGTLDVIAPPKLGSSACVAALYALEAFARLSGKGEETELELSFPDALTAGEARALLAAYLRVDENNSALSRRCAVRCETRTASAILDLKARLTSHSELPAMPELQLTPGREEEMYPELEETICEALENYSSSSSSADNCRETVHGSNSEDEGCIANVPLRDSQRCAGRTGHVVLFGLGGETSSSFRWVRLGLRTLGLSNLSILRACGIFRGKCGRNRAMLRLPGARGVLPDLGCKEAARGLRTRLTDDLCVVPGGEETGAWLPFTGLSSLPPQLLSLVREARRSKRRVRIFFRHGGPRRRSSSSRRSGSGSSLFDGSDERVGKSGAQRSSQGI